MVDTLIEQRNQLFQKVVGRTSTASDQSFLSDAASRKTGPALEGAIAWHNQRGDFGGGAVQDSVAPQGQPMNLEEALITTVRKTLAKVGELEQRISAMPSVNDQNTAVQDLARPATEGLYKQRGELANKFQTVYTNALGELDAKKFADPMDVFKSAAAQRGTVAQQLSDIQAEISLQRNSAADIINNTMKQRQQEIDSAQEIINMNKDLISQITAITNEQRDASMAPLERARVQAATNASNRSGANSSNKVSEIAGDVQKIFDDSRGQDGFVSPSVYRDTRSKAIAAGVDGKDFDEAFANNLKQEERYSLGISPAGSNPTTSGSLTDILSKLTANQSSN